MSNNKDSLVKKYIDDHQKSAILHKRAKKLFTADGATHFIRILNPYRPYITHADGCKKWDVDGNEYIDYIMGHGALLLGHNHPDVVRAVQEQMSRGVLYGENHALEVEWAELIQEMMPSAERVLLFPCGNEANMMALRLCRVFTGRNKVLRFEKHYHGWADELASPTEPSVCHDNVVFIPPNNLNKLEEELSKKEYAALFTEAGGAFLGGRTPLDIDSVRQIHGLAQKYGTLWVLDEVVTGFRVSPGGWQGVVGVKPDLTTLGKCVGGGLSAGALIGRADIFEALNPKNAPGLRVQHGGTWNANPLTASAGIAACKLFKTGEPQKKSAEAAALLRKEGNKILKERGISGAFYGQSSIVYLYFGPIDHEITDETVSPTKDAAKLTDPSMTPILNRLLIHLLQRGIANILGSIFIFSTMHTGDDVDKTINAFRESIDAMLNEGSLSAVR